MKYSPIIILVFSLFACSKSNHTEQLISGEAQGTTYTVKYLGEANPHLKSALDSVLLEIDKSMSTYRQNSKISELNEGNKIYIDNKFLSVFKRSKEINQLTNGAFDPTIGPIISAWGFNFENPMKLDSFLVDSLKQLCGFRYFKVQGNEISKLKAESSLNFNAIAQGYSVDLMANELDKKGISNYYVELGGELKVKGKNKEGEFWRIGIDKPVGDNLDRKLSHIISLENKSMATSGNYRKYYEIDGTKYSHTLDPITGYPVKHNLLSATVIADNCMDADAFGTSFMVLGLEKSKILLKKLPELDAILIYAEGGKLKSFYTPRIRKEIEEL